MSEALEQPTWLETWEAPPAFLEGDPRTACYAGVEGSGAGFESLICGVVGCGIGMLVMGVIAIGYLQGLLAGSKALRADTTASGVFRSDPPPPAVKAVKAIELGALDQPGTVRRKL